MLNPLSGIALALVCGLPFSAAGHAGLRQDPTAPAVAAETAGAEQQDPAAPSGNLPADAAAKPELNAEFASPDLDVDQWVKRFELESREIYGGRKEILKHLALAPGRRIADIGAGTGFFSLMFAELVGENGQVFAVDIGPRFLEHISSKAAEQGLVNLTPVLAGSQRSNLPLDSIDLAFVCDTYHHFEHPGPTLESIHRALAENGELFVIDFERIPGKSRDWVLDHVRADKATFRAEIEACGFEFVEEIAISNFAENYLLKFRKKQAAAAGN